MSGGITFSNFSTIKFKERRERTIIYNKTLQETVKPFHKEKNVECNLNSNKSHNKKQIWRNQSGKYENEEKDMEEL